MRLARVVQYYTLACCVTHMCPCPHQVKKHWDSILDVTAIVLANLCVAYIMTTQVGEQCPPRWIMSLRRPYCVAVQNDEAEEVMRRIEREEERWVRDPLSPLRRVGTPCPLFPCLLQGVCRAAHEAVLPPLHRKPCHRDALLRQG